MQVYQGHEFFNESFVDMGGGVAQSALHRYDDETKGMPIFCHSVDGSSFRHARLVVQ